MANQRHRAADCSQRRAGFFFINPAGITFGAGASVDVPGAFHVSTANSVKFADGRFNADLGQGSTLSSAAPEAFGFLGSTRAGIAIKDRAVVQPRTGFPVGSQCRLNRQGRFFEPEGNRHAPAGQWRFHHKRQFFPSCAHRRATGLCAFADGAQD